MKLFFIFIILILASPLSLFSREVKESSSEIEIFIPYYRIQKYDAFISQNNSENGNAAHSAAELRNFFLENLALGLLFGIIAGMSVYHLFLFFILKKEIHLFYNLTATANFLYLISHHAVLWNFFPDMRNTFMTFHEILTALSVLISAVFAWKFLKISKFESIYFRIAFRIFGIFFLMILLPAVLGFHEFSVSASLFARLFYILFVAAGILSFKKGFRPARHYIVSSGLVFLSFTALFIQFSFTGSISETAVHAVILALSAESVILSYAVSVSIKVLRDENIQKTKTENKYREMSFTDELTSLYNKRYYTERIQLEIKQSLLTKESLSVIVLDIDDFKKINDTFGHLEGDRILKILSETIRGNIRSTDIACRYGGEEFIIILPGTSSPQAERIADQIRILFSQRTRRYNFNVMKNILKIITKQRISDFASFSAGVAEYRKDESHDDLFKRADEALYSAKKKGKNRSIIAA